VRQRAGPGHLAARGAYNGASCRVNRIAVAPLNSGHTIIGRVNGAWRFDRSINTAASVQLLFWSAIHRQK
jgi:hypothetical protein